MSQITAAGNDHWHARHSCCWNSNQVRPKVMAMKEIEPSLAQKQGQTKKLVHAPNGVDATLGMQLLVVHGRPLQLLKQWPPCLQTAQRHIVNRRVESTCQLDGL